MWIRFKKGYIPHYMNLINHESLPIAGYVGTFRYLEHIRFIWHVLPLSPQWVLFSFKYPITKDFQIALFSQWIRRIRSPCIDADQRSQRLTNSTIRTQTHFCKTPEIEARWKSVIPSNKINKSPLLGFITYKYSITKFSIHSPTICFPWTKIIDHFLHYAQNTTHKNTTRWWWFRWKSKRRQNSPQNNQQVST